MTYIITQRNQNSILMASDTRLNYFNDIEIEGDKHQKITLTADCIQKTFYIKKAKMGIQFLGIGYFPDGENKYPLSHFINQLESLKYVKNFKINSKTIFDFFNSLSNEEDTGQYVKGIMTGFVKKKAHITTFNTFDGTFECIEFGIGKHVDSEGNKNDFSRNEEQVITEIKRRINLKEEEKWWSIGGPIDILKITQEGGKFLTLNKNSFKGTQSELLHCFQNDIGKINGKILKEPKIIKYS